MVILKIIQNYQKTSGVNEITRQQILFHTNDDLEFLLTQFIISYFMLANCHVIPSYRCHVWCDSTVDIT